MISTPCPVDLHAWAFDQAALLRAGRFDELDYANLALELEVMGRSQRRELVSRLAILLVHLLKWRHQPERRSRSWRIMIQIQWSDLTDLLEESPSLQGVWSESMLKAYNKARLLAAGETGLPEATFPSSAPWNQEEMARECLGLEGSRGDDHHY
ncbi:MAG: DUF29 domain-containing protein [Magnetococcus sp. YQC-5]